MKYAIILPLLCMASVVYGQELPTYPQSGYWFDHDDPGTGLNIEIQNGILAGNYYGYDGSGQDTWLQFSGQLIEGDADTLYFLESDLIRFSDGECVTNCDESSTVDSSMLAQETVGTIRLEFNSLAQAKVIVDDGEPIEVQAYTFGTTTNEFPSGYLWPDYNGDWSFVFERQAEGGELIRQSFITSIRTPTEPPGIVVCDPTPCVITFEQRYDISLEQQSVADLLSLDPLDSDEQELSGNIHCLQEGEEAELTCALWIVTDDTSSVFFAIDLDSLRLDQFRASERIDLRVDGSTNSPITLTAYRLSIAPAQ